MPDHLYTMDVAEVTRSIAQYGYHLEGIACYVYATHHAGTVPIYRAYNPTTRDHFYTTDQVEYERSTAQHGYQAEFFVCTTQKQVTISTRPIRLNTNSLRLKTATDPKTRAIMSMI